MELHQIGRMVVITIENLPVVIAVVPPCLCGVEKDTASPQAGNGDLLCFMTPSVARNGWLASQYMIIYSFFFSNLLLLYNFGSEQGFWRVLGPQKYLITVLTRKTYLVSYVCSSSLHCCLGDDCVFMIRN